MMIGIRSQKVCFIRNNDVYIGNNDVYNYGSVLNVVYFNPTGLRDYSPFLSLHTVLDFWQSVGVQRIREYVYQLCRDAGMYEQKYVSPWGLGGSQV